MIFLDITDSELMVFKCIMDSEEHITVVEIIEHIKALYGKEWKRSTVCTFISHLIDKGYVASYRKGVSFYYYSLIDEQTFKKAQAKEFLDFWFKGSISNMVSCLCSAQSDSFSKEEIDSLKKEVEEL